LWIKRDDLCGPGFGGNKVRKLDFILAEAQAAGCDAIITTGGEGSNHCRVTAAVAARLGLRCILVLNRSSRQGGTAASRYLDELYGAEIHYVDSRRDRGPAMHVIALAMRTKGRRVAEIPLGASTPLGALGYATAVEELAGQCRERGVPLEAIYHSTSSGGTQAGIDAGLQLLGLTWRLTGVSADDSAESITRTVHAILDGVASLLDIEAGALRRPLHVDDSQVGEGYGIPTQASEEALSLVARTEGIVLDPVYTAKAMAGLFADLRAGRLDDCANVVFWHTGGQLALFHRLGALS
jgi:1-aminocyclopropane-1-carboxylate deaminase/D-cysteine desulfhydrase-like pyridoxal-dependent ACC family enzyme